MALTVRIKPRARREVNEAAAWWSEKRLAAPGAVSHDLQAALKLLVEFPEIGTKVENTKSSETRRWLLKRVSHHVYYRVRGNYFEVVAFWSTDRGHEPRI